MITKKIVAVAATVAAGFLAVNIPAAEHNHAVYRDTSKALSSIPVTTGSPYQLKVTNFLNLSLNEGDIVTINSNVQVTTPYTPNVMVGRALRVQHPGGATEYIRVPMSQNFTWNVHHLPTEVAGRFQAPGSGTYQFQHINYAASSAAGSNWNLTVDYADMSAEVTYF